MAVAAFALLFILLGLGVLLVALRGGPSAARERLQGVSRRGRGLILAGFLVIVLVLGVLIPVGVVAMVNSRDAIPEASVAELTDTQKRGRELFAQRCANCHTLKAANAAAQVGPNLDDLRPPKGLVLDAIANGRARGNGNMAADLVEGEDAEAVAQFVAVAGGQSPAGEGAGAGAGGAAPAGE